MSIVKKVMEMIDDPKVGCLAVGVDTPRSEEPMTISEFAKYIGMSPAMVLALPFGDLCQLLKKNSFFLSGDGVIPKDYSKGK